MSMRIDLHEPITKGEQIAYHTAKIVGSWKFIITQTICVIIWVVLNVAGFILQWDPYPFILLNLMFSVQAAYTGPILLLSSNRQAQKDRELSIRDDEELTLLLNIQNEQLEILKYLKDKF